MKMLLATTAILSMAALGAAAQAQTDRAEAGAGCRPPFPTTSCWPTGAARTTAFRRGTRSSPSCSRRRSSSRSTSSAARSLAIANNPAAPTFANTIEALEKAGQRLDRVESVFGVMTRQHVDAGISGARQGMVAEAVRRVRRDHAQPEALPADQGALRQQGVARPRRQAAAPGDAHATSGFVRRGANLDAAAEAAAVGDQPAARRACSRPSASACSPTRAPTSAATEAELKGVPADVKAALAAAAKERKQPAGHYRDQEHALGGRSGPDLRRQPRPSREGVARVRQPRRQWRRQRHQRRSSPRS